MTRPSLRAIAGLSTIALTVSCTYLGGQYPQRPTASASSSSSPTEWSDIAAGLMLDGPSWAPIPVGEYGDTRIERVDIDGDTLYAVDGNQRAHAINLGAGSHRWVLDLDAMPSEPVAVGRSHVAFVSDRHVTVATRDSGTMMLSRDLGFSPSSRPALSRDTLYVGSWGDGYNLRSVSLYDGWRGWAQKADGPITGAPLVVGSGADSALYFASHDGSVIALDPRPASAKRPSAAIWVSNTLGPNGADLAHDDDSIYVACEDRALYSLSRSSGVVQWKWLGSATPLTAPPQVGSAMVYQPSGASVVAIDRETGVESYRVAKAERFLTRVGGRDYFKAAGDGVIAVDAQTGEVLAELHSPMFDQIPSNPLGGALVFSDGTSIYSLQ